MLSGSAVTGASGASPDGAIPGRLRRLEGLLRTPAQPYLWMLVIAVAAATLTITRRPDSVFHAQFWAEDGHNWYAEAYNKGWLQAALTPFPGYFQTITRLTAALSLLVNFANAPLVFNVIALVIQVLPAVFLVTPRFQKVIPDFRIRVLLVLIYIGIPNSFELDANITNSMTHLGLLAVLIILAEPSQRMAWRAFDVFWMALSGVSGPFVIALVPVALLRSAFDRGCRWRLVLLGVVVLCAAIQALAVLTTSSATRPHPPLGATPHGFMAIVTGNVFAGAVIGLNHYSSVFAQPWWEPHRIALRATFVVGIAIFLYAAFRAGVELRLFVLFAWILLVASLLTPVLSLTGQQWPLLAHPGAGDRYYLIPMLAFLASAVWIMCRSRIKLLRLAAGAVIVATILIGIPGDWSYPPYADFHPEQYAKILDRAAPGSRVVIPINPPGWDVELNRK